ncbi:MAG: TonB family protein [Chthoniobacterales bacterium]
MSTAALLYRPNAKWPVAGAFAAALILHLCAVALASHRAIPPVEVAPQSVIDVIGIEEADPAPPVPLIDETLPPPPLATAEFIDASPPAPPSARRERRPVRATTAVRAAGVLNPRALALRAPQPDYPYEARRNHVTGSGIVALTIDSANGDVVDAEMEQSTGSSVLDQSALAAFRRWQFKIGTPPRVHVPITFTINGAQL